MNINANPVTIKNFFIYIFNTLFLIISTVSDGMWMRYYFVLYVKKQDCIVKKNEKSIDGPTYG